MEPIRFVHTSDWCLAAPYEFAPGSVADKLRKLQRKAIEALADGWGQGEESPDLLFITGNLFSEPTPSLDTLEWLRSLFRRLREMDVQVCVLRGPTDPRDPSWAEGAGVHLFQEETRTTVGPCTIHALPPQASRRGENLLRHLAGREEADILLFVGHLIDDENEQADCHPFRKEDLAALPYKYAALGGRRCAQVFVDLEGTFAAYAGSPFATSFSKDDLGSRFFVEGRLEEGTVFLERRRLGVPEFGAVRMDCTGKAPEELLSRIGKRCRSASRSASILHVSLEGTPSLRTLSFRDTLGKALEGVVWLDLDTQFNGIDLGEEEDALVRRFVERIGEERGLDEATRQVALELGVKALVSPKDG